MRTCRCFQVFHISGTAGRIADVFFRLCGKRGRPVYRSFRLLVANRILLHDFPQFFFVLHALFWLLWLLLIISAFTFGFFLGLKRFLLVIFFFCTCNYLLHIAILCSSLWFHTECHVFHITPCGSVAVKVTIMSFLRQQDLSELQAPVSVITLLEGTQTAPDTGCSREVASDISPKRHSR